MGAFRYCTEDDTNANSWVDHYQHVGKSYRCDLWIFCFRGVIYCVTSMGAFINSTEDTNANSQPINANKCEFPANQDANELSVQTVLVVSIRVFSTAINVPMVASSN
jgi:hypothetical protein